MTLKLKEKRAELNRIDDELLRLLNERARVVSEIGHDKKRFSRPVYDLVREHFVLTRLRRANTGPLETRTILRIFHRILSESRRLQENIRREGK